MTDLPRPEYPRPQFRRERWVNLNGPWGFAYDDEDQGLRGGWSETPADRLDAAFPRTIMVPYCFQAPLSGIGETAFHDVVWYGRAFRPELGEGERLLLHFGAVDYRADVWVNGVHVAAHEGGHTPFEADVTHALGDGENALVVRAQDPTTDITIPRGKQYWKEQSESIFYTRTTGIWQTVWLEPVGATRIDNVRLIPDLPSGSVDLEVEVTEPRPGLALRVTARFGAETVASDTYGILGGRLERRIPLARDTTDRYRLPLWSPERPNLYDLRLELLDLDKEGAVLDTVKTYTGLRSVEAREGGVYLNGQPLYQRLVLDQGYWPDGLLTAPTDDDLRRDIELAKEMGFNGARKHQKVEDPRWLYWADRLGFLVWGEMANAYGYSPAYVGRITREWQEAVERDYNHPAIIVWTPMNESWGVQQLPTDPRQVEHLLSLYHLTRSLDRTRPVISNDGWEHALTDLCTIHDYGTPEDIRVRYATPESSVAARPARRAIYCPGNGYRGEPILITEFGGVAFQRDEQRGWGYRTVEGADELLGAYGALIEALVACPPVQGFCYTQLTDVEQEVNGLLTYHREPKAPLERIRELTERPRATLPELA